MGTERKDTKTKISAHRVKHLQQVTLLQLSSEEQSKSQSKVTNGKF
jgi:hypothetical protein